MKKLILRHIKITRIKLFIARLLYRFTRIIYSNPIQKVERGGLKLELDLREGIDLHVFWFGLFQKHVYENELIQIPSDGVILDIGGNIGMMSLVFAQKVPQGKVHSFEPTDYAIQKFRTNMALNPDLASRIILNQSFVSYESKDSVNIKVFSSWPVVGSEDKHAIHQGVLKSGDNIPSIRLDDYCTNAQLERVDFVKIDTDGYEWDVLRGSKEMLKKYKPQVIFEIGIYVMQEKGISFSDYEDFFTDLGYRLYTVKNQSVSRTNFEDHIPRYGTIDLIALPA